MEVISFGYLSEYLNTPPTRRWQVNFASGQVDLQLTCLDRHVEFLENYQKYYNIVPHIINFEVFLWFKPKLGKLIFIQANQ